MMGSPQIHEMINELQEDALRRVSLHRIDALTRRGGMREAVASTLVRIGMTIDRDAGERVLCDEPRVVQRAPTLDGDVALRW